jgi:hypothetical protein
VGDPAFGWSGLVILLLGQQVEAPAPVPRVGREAWARKVEAWRRTVERALDQRQALELVRARPELLRELVDSPRSWCSGDAEVVDVSPGTGRARWPHDRF